MRRARCVSDDLGQRPANERLREFLGTFLLVLGSAVFGLDRIGAVGVALAFGLVLLALAYAIGPISGCRVNPAVTLGMLLTRRVAFGEAAAYWVVQILGAIARGRADHGAHLVRKGPGPAGRPGHQLMGVTVYGGGAFVIEVVLTFLFVFVILLVTNRPALP